VEGSCPNTNLKLTMVNYKSQKEECAVQILIDLIGGAAGVLLIYYVVILMRGDKQ